MVDSFVEGAKSEGASVNEFKLSKYDIHHCTGHFEYIHTSDLIYPLCSANNSVAGLIWDC